MVDPVNGIPPVPGVAAKSASSGSKAAPSEKSRVQDADSVEISSEAISLQDAERTAAATRRILETSDLFLGLDLSKLSEPA